MNNEYSRASDNLFNTSSYIGGKSLNKGGLSAILMPVFIVI
jgi:hypothetical protein